MERQNQRLRRAVIGVAVAGLSLLVMGQTLPPKAHDVVRAKKFEVVRDDGRTMVVIDSGSDNGWIFVNGKNGAIVVIGADDSILLFESLPQAVKFFDGFFLLF